MGDGAQETIQRMWSEGGERWNHMCMTTGRHLRSLLFPRGSNRAKLGSALPPSCFSTYGTATTWEEDHVSHHGELSTVTRLCRLCGAFRSAGKGTDEDQARPTGGC